MQTKHYSVAILLVVAAISSSFYLNALIGPAAPIDAKLEVREISADRFLKNVTFLARDEMRGRGNGSPELEKAADYIASQFRMWGLKPAGDRDTFFQSFDVTTGTDFGEKNDLALNGMALKIDRDFVPISFSNTSDFEGEVAFA